MKIILTRPTDNSLEAFISFRKNNVFKFKEVNKVLIKEEIVKEWEKFWRLINERTDRRICADRRIN